MDFVPINHIILEADRPKIAGTGFTVQDIVAMHLWNHSPLEWIQAEYGLSLAQIHAALAYYYDHQAEIDALFEADKQDWEQRATPAESLLTTWRKRKK